MFRKLISLLLCLCMILTMLPATQVISAAEQSSAPSIEEQKYTSDTTLAEPEEPQYCQTLEEAGAVVRQQMKARQETVVVHYQMPGDFTSMSSAIFWEAMKHTGVPTEGDYLRYQCSGYSCSTSYYTTGGVCYMTLTYSVSYFSTAEQEKIVDQAIADILLQLGVSLRGSGYDAIKTIYEWICANVSYDYGHMEDDSYAPMRSAYGAVINFKAVCQGYAVLLYRMLLEAGIDNRIVTGTGDGVAHAWNIVKLNGDYYNLDATWDASQFQFGSGLAYFLRGSAGFTDHVRDEEHDSPEFHETYPVPVADYALPAVWQSGSCGKNITWMLGYDGTMILSGTGDMYDYDYSETPWFDYRDSIRTVIVEEGITGVGDNAFIYCRNLQEVRLAQSLKRIGEYAFNFCSSLSGLELPAGLTAIDTYAFAGCKALTGSLWIPDGVTEISYGAFNSCEGLTSVRLPDGVTEIDDSAFWGCYDLADINFPKSLTRIGDDAFYGCSITSVILPEGLITLEGAFTSCAFLETVVLPDTLLSIGNGAFMWCRGLKRITIPFSVSEIGSTAFRDCTSLEEVVFKGSAPQMQDSTFYGTATTCYYPAGVASWDYACMDYSGTLTWVAYDTPGGVYASGSCGDAVTWALDTSGVLTISGSGEMMEFTELDAPWYPAVADIRTLVIKEGVTSIGTGAFMDCENLQAIQLPDSLQSIGNVAFGGCSSLRSFTIPKGLSSFGNAVFLWCDNLSSITVHPENPWFSIDEKHVLYSKDKTQLVSAPATLSGSYTIPEGVTSIGQSAFTYCWNLTEVSIPESVKSIGFYAFSGCSGLTKMELPAGLTTIEDGAFNGCSGLTQIKIPSGVTRIGGAAFMGCRNLQSVELPQNLKEIGYSAFNGCSALTEVTLPERVVTIGHDAFYGCSGLTRIRIPAGVTSLEETTFSDCGALEEIVFLGDAPAFGDNVFFGVTANAYYDSQNATWNDSVLLQHGGTITWAGCDVENICTDDHAYVNWYTTEKPRCVLEGAERSDCENCDAFTCRTVPQTNHFYMLTMVQASETTSGYNFYECANCHYGYYEFLAPNSLTRSDAILLLRDAIVHRRMNVDISYYDSQPLTESSANAFYEDVVDHCGVSYLGDYHTGHPVPSGFIYNYASSAEGDQYRNYIEIGFSYCTSFETEQKVFSKVAAIMEELDLDGLSDYEKVLRICNYIVDNVVYYADGTGNSHKAFCPILYGYSVCQGYALMAYRLLLEAGIDCRYVVGGTSQGLHAWNIVKIGDLYYNLDTTWMDSRMKDWVDYKWFLKCEENFDDHNRWSEYDTEEFREKYPMAQTDLVVDIGNCGEDSYWVLKHDGTLVFFGSGAVNYESNWYGYDWTRYRAQIRNIIVTDGITSLPRAVLQHLDYLESVFFEGDAPEFDNLGAWFLDSVQVYYPAGNATWESRELDDELGVITWKPYTAAGTCKEDIRWMLLEDGTFYLSGQGDMTTNVGYFPWFFDYAGKIKNVIIGEGITSIGEAAFENCSNLVSVSIPDTVTKIDDYAFMNCTGLTSVTVPAGVTSIGEGAFYSCESLEKITFRGDAPEICFDAFWFVTTDAYYPKGNPTWTEDKREGYYGYINWIGYDTIVVSEIPDISGATGDEIAVTVRAEGESLSYAWYLRMPGDASFVLLEETGTTLSLKLENGMNGAEVYCIVSDTEGNKVSTNTATVTMLSRLQPDEELAVEISYGEVETLLFTPVASCFFHFVSIGDEFSYAELYDIDGVLLATPTFPDGNNFDVFCRLQAGQTYQLKVRLINEAFMGAYRVTVRQEHGEISTETEVEASCTQDGLLRHTCGACGESWTEAVEAAHRYQDGSCVYCGKGQPLASGQCGEAVYWELATNGALRIYGTGAMTDFEEYNIPWQQYAENITSLCVEDGVTTLGSYALYNCANLSDVSLADTVCGIGEIAFYGCSSLTKITLPENVTEIKGWTFYMCSALEEITICGDVTAIGNSAFFFCEALQQIQLPQSLVTISDNAFSACNGLTELTIPAGVTEIGDYAFAWCNYIRSLTFEGNAPVMKENAFYGIFTTAYYPASDASWNANTLQQYGALELTWTPVGHVHSYTDSVTEHTCTQQGYTTHTCACGEEYTDSYVDPLGHDLTQHAGKSATCTQGGWEAYETCSRCDHSTYEAIAALGHDLTQHAGKSATCTQGGWKAYETCSRCDHTTYAQIPATGHSYTATVTKPTCTAKGYTTHTCACGDAYVDSYVNALGHAFTNYKSDANATTEKDGTKTALCDRGCGAKNTVTDAGSKLPPAVITSGKYTVSDGWIRKIAAGTTAADLLKGISGSGVRIVKNGKVISGNTKVGTGMVVQLLVNGKLADEKTVIVTGDVNGDGSVSVTDMIAVKSHLLGKSKLTGASEKAADTSSDKKISITDFIQIKAHILGKSAVTPS